VGSDFLKNGRQAAIVLSWLLLVQLPGQVLRSYSSKVSKSKRFLIVKQILVYSVTAKFIHRTVFGGSVLVHTNAIMVRL
jgi:hypothetical protein